MNKQTKMESVRAEAERIGESCDPGRPVVLGEGDLDATLVVVGEAPGAAEEREGRPFVGAAGKLLREELVSAGLDQFSLYLANVVKVRPVDEEDGKRRNRRPTASEVGSWSHLLLEEISVIGPEKILCLGGTAAAALLDRGVVISRERGKWLRGRRDFSLLITYHPASISRGGRSRLDQFRKDLRAVRQALTPDDSR